MAAHICGAQVQKSKLFAQNFLNKICLGITVQLDFMEDLSGGIIHQKVMLNGKMKDVVKFLVHTTTHKFYKDYKYTYIWFLNLEKVKKINLYFGYNK